MTTSIQCPLDFPAAYYSKNGDVPPEAERLMAELLPLVIANKLLDAESFRRSDWLGHVHKMDLPPNVSQALQLLGLDVPEGRITLDQLAGTLSSRIAGLSRAYLVARTGLNLDEGFYVVHTNYVKAEVKFWPAVSGTSLSFPQVVLTGRPQRLRSDGTHGTETNSFGEWLRPDDDTWIIPAAACPSKKDKAALYRAAVNLAAQLKEPTNASA
jgi:hypothetical protein